METVIADTIVLSDLHLGSEVSHAREAAQLLRGAMFRRLILLGDIFCDLNFRRLKKEHWRFLSLIRKLSNPKRGVEVVWVEGNHDYGLSEVMSHLVGIPVYQEFAWSYRGKKYLAIHGHQFDRFLVNNGVLSKLGEFIYLQIQKVDLKSSPIARWLDRLNSRWLRLTPKVAQGALAFARMRGAQVVLCGHTHHAFQREENGIAYFNSGCWTHKRLTYIAVDENGAAIVDYQPPAVSDDWAEDDAADPEPPSRPTVPARG